MKTTFIKAFVKRSVCFLLLAAIALSAAGCKRGPIAPGTIDLMTGIAARQAHTPAAPEKAKTEKAADFAVRLFKACFDGEKNCLISPLSVLSALSMTMNGAKEETLAAMERTLGMTKDELNVFYADYASVLPSGEKYKLCLANSIWFPSDGGLTVNKDFLQTNADYYGAQIYEADFDNSTLKDINRWVKQNTDGMIDEILDEIPPEAVMYLINALAFEAEWENVYKKSEVKDGVFTTENGEKRSVKMMRSDDEAYIGDEYADGFVKYYAGRKYAFAALLPKEGMTVAEYVSKLDGETLEALLSNAGAERTAALLPKFKAECGTLLNDALKAMGMEIAFDDERADFTGVGNARGNIYISRVLHKTFISVDEKGTKAGAATAVELSNRGAALQAVVLDRPFVYMLIDCETNLPFFIGTMMDAEG